MGRIRLMGCWVGILFLATSVVRADWSPETIQFINQMSQKQADFPDLSMQSAWSVVRRKLRSTAADVKYGFESFNLPSNHFKAGSLKAIRYLQPTFRYERKVKDYKRVKNKQPQVAPLMVYLTGLFSDAHEVASKDVLRKFIKRGYHVLVLPNTYSSDFWQGHPKMLPGDVEAEGKIVIDAIKSFIKLTGADRFTTIETYGESYGAILGTIVAAMDDENLITRHTGLGPPAAVGSAVANLDAMLDQYEDFYFSQCTGLINLIQYGLDFLFAGLSLDQNRLNPQTLQCIQAAVPWKVFHPSLIKISHMIHEQTGYCKVPSPEEERRYRFANFADECLIPDNVIRNKAGHDSIFYWIGKTQENDKSKGLNGTRVRILTSADDFLNHEEDWRNGNFIGLTQSNLLILPWGGHVGYIGAHGFSPFYDYAFGPEIPNRLGRDRTDPDQDGLDAPESESSAEN